MRVGLVSFRIRFLVRRDPRTKPPVRPVRTQPEDGQEGSFQKPTLPALDRCLPASKTLRRFMVDGGTDFFWNLEDGQWMTIAGRSDTPLEDQSTNQELRVDRREQLSQCKRNSCPNTARPRKCFSNITGYCRKKCEMGEIYEVACRNGKLCCVNEGENKKHKKAPKSPSFLVQSDGKMDYVILPTTTLLTIQI
ncbi:beta-defensin 128 [Acinonyx jubatus]|uniref:Beta-defensin n=1 Tax=Acinonyx jubatus TaxID=32536 RepID=A0ABM3N9J5_ACIJB|nr:beta-defensin 128 [Acinonyx jubatus]